MTYQKFPGIWRRHRTVASGCQLCLYAGPGSPRSSADVLVRAVGAVAEVIARAVLSHHRPVFGIDHVAIGGRSSAICEVAVHRTPFMKCHHVQPGVGHYLTIRRYSAGHERATGMPRRGGRRSVAVELGDFLEK